MFSAMKTSEKRGHATAQEVGRWLPVAAQIQSQVRSCGICGRQFGTGASFLRVLQFLVPIVIPATHYHPITDAI
jgi:hypothetical protein